MRTRLFVVIVMVLVGGAAAPWNNVLASPDCPNVVEQGLNNTADDFQDCATVSGGFANSASFGFATVSGGYGNDASSDYATVGGGKDNTASRYYATVGGGNSNTASGNHATVGGGSVNTASSDYATVGGGYFNRASGFIATVGGGDSNTASSSYATVGGGNVNRATDYGSVVGGGTNNQAGDNAGTLADQPYATVAGGVGNTASGSYSAIGGGLGNTASATFATIGGGGLTNPSDAATANRVTDSYGTVGGGGNNQAGDTTTSNRAYATVSGGRSNRASGTYATVAGGFTNLASGSYSFAAGRQAKALHSGSFVWGDGSAANVSSTGLNQFIARASGGVTFFSTADATAGVRLEPGAGAWSTLSDRNSKANITAVDSASILERLASIPIQLWNYKAQDASVKHIGPMAQDFAAAFGVGENDTTISTVDADGVALAAIQGLYQENVSLRAEKDAQLAALKAEKDRQITSLQAEVATFRTEAAKVQERLAAVEQAQQPTVTPGVSVQLLVLAVVLGSVSTLVLCGLVALGVMQVRRRRTIPA